LNGWLKSADVEDGIKPGLTDAEHVENGHVQRSGV
jgi:hypothetical protein